MIQGGAVTLLNSFPYPTIRPHQAEALQVLEENWSNYDVFVIIGPTAFGKSAFSKTILNYFHRASLVTPTNLLVDQYRTEFPDTNTLRRLDSYYCEEWQRPCSSTRNKLMKFCKGCACGKDMATAKYTRGAGVYNYHIYMAHKLYRDVLVVDECHNLLPTIQDRMAIKLWQHTYKYPSNMYTAEQTLAWIDSLPDTKKKNKKLKLLKEACKYQVPEYVMQRTKEWFNGKGTVRGEPEERDLIKLLPVDISGAPPMFWPSEVKKIVLMSATIGQKDIERLGLSRKRVLFIECKSPIPAENRPILFQPITTVSRGNMEEAVDKLAEYIQDVANYHAAEKGVVHATYQVASMLRERLRDRRFLFHSRHNKAEVYQQFRDMPTDQAPILVACGMYEGIDLPEDLGRWQVLSKIPWPSLASPAVKHLADLDPEWYSWECLKTVIQACGRVCRTERDYGVSYIPDASFRRLLTDAKHLMPDFFLEALQIVD